MSDITDPGACCEHDATKHRLSIDRDESDPDPAKWTITPRLNECRECGCQKWVTRDA